MDLEGGCRRRRVSHNLLYGGKEIWRTHGFGDIGIHPDGHIWQIRAEATVRQPVQLTLYGETFNVMAGELLEVFFSNRFTPQVMPGVLAEAGLTLLQTFLFDSQEEAIYLCVR